MIAAGRHIVRPARIEELGSILSFVADACAAYNIDDDACFALRLATEEVCANVIKHGYPAAAPGPLSVALRCSGDSIVITIEDAARPFDPADAPPPDLTSGWRQRQAGGLGWHLVRQLMDDVRREPLTHIGNRYTLVKRISPEHAQASNHDS